MAVVVRSAELGDRHLYYCFLFLVRRREGGDAIRRETTYAEASGYRVMMMASLRSEAPRISAQIGSSEGNTLQLHGKGEHVGVFELSTAGRRDVITLRQEIRSRKSSLSICRPDQHHWTQTKLPGQYTGLKRSSSAVEKRCERMPSLNDENLLRSFFCTNNLASTISTSSSLHQLVHESLYSRFVDYATQQCGQKMVLKPYPVKVRNLWWITSIRLTEANHLSPKHQFLRSVVIQ